MKAISIRQPWASLTAAGIRDIDLSNRDTNYRGPVLIVASSRRVGRDFGHDVPLDWYCRVRNAQALGWIPYDEELPVGCAVGMAMLEDCTTAMQDSPWSALGNNWVLRDARVFCTPLSGLKGKQGLFDVPEIKEEGLPMSNCLPSPWSRYEEGVYSLSMTEEEQDRQIPDWPLVLMVCNDGLVNPLLEPTDKGYRLKPIRQLRLVSPQGSSSFDVARAQLLTEEREGRSYSYLAIDFEMSK